MSEELETQQAAQTGAYQDPIATPEGGQPKKKSKFSGADVAATVGAVVIFRLFGLLGGLLCYAGYWAVRAVIKSKMATAVKVILSIVLILVFLVLLFVYVLFAASITAGA